MEFSRRDTLGLGLGAAALTMLPLRVVAATEDRIAEFTGGAKMADTGLTLTAPEIAENGNTVPIAVDAPGATAIMILATGNPTPGVATFAFGPLAASQSASTRIRLAGTQDIVAVAKMADGSFAKASSTVKVTIGGCGG
ncbi:thiosulfate oxidation carrier protein SoxY [Phaeobacter sp. LSS9]|uniref:thiosulfate oxidation carrier protein SoxY n=1 Tax=unclassified Phaeobacter TaxID=2621772 RepID=UPI000E49F5A6|nr:thiosulfate oxidation carrier protein SoxY [Phaeobacter sp. LSS9]AXT33884.1 thiosulfate oxidation carrier protein SoxY [Phaeobacter sp. LSS9]